MGDPRLREVSRPVDAFDTPELRELVDDMFETMQAADGAGLAAPQIGVMRRVMMFGVESNPRYPDADRVPMTVLINPEFEGVGDDVIGDWEGCLSVPGMHGYVSTPGNIRYRGFDQSGKLIERSVNGFHATVFQHEFDHLEGVLYPDLIENPTKFGFIDEVVASGAISSISGQ